MMEFAKMMQIMELKLIVQQRRFVLSIMQVNIHQNRFETVFYKNHIQSGTRELDHEEMH